MPKPATEKKAKARTEFAEHRTHWAEDRTAMAYERTFAGWMRTAFTVIAIGLGFVALFDSLRPEWVAKVISTGLVGFGMVIVYVAQARACRSLARLSLHEIEALPIRQIRFVSATVIVSSAVLILAFWLMR